MSGLEFRVRDQLRKEWSSAKEELCYSVHLGSHWDAKRRLEDESAAWEAYLAMAEPELGPS